MNFALTRRAGVPQGGRARRARRGSRRRGGARGARRRRAARPVADRGRGRLARPADRRGARRRRPGALEAMLVFAELGRVLASVAAARPPAGHAPARRRGRRRPGGARRRRDRARRTCRPSRRATSRPAGRADPRFGHVRRPAPVLADGKVTGERRLGAGRARRPDCSSAWRSARTAARGRC